MASTPSYNTIGNFNSLKTFGLVHVRTSLPTFMPNMLIKLS
jgi:hypothetical protein